MKFAFRRPGNPKLFVEAISGGVIWSSLNRARLFDNTQEAIEAARKCSVPVELVGVKEVVIGEKRRRISVAEAIEKGAKFAVAWDVGRDFAPWYFVVDRRYENPKARHEADMIRAEPNFHAAVLYDDYKSAMGAIERRAMANKHTSHKDNLRSELFLVGVEVVPGEVQREVVAL